MKKTHQFCVAVTGSFTNKRSLSQINEALKKKKPFLLHTDKATEIEQRGASNGFCSQGDEI